MSLFSYLVVIRADQREQADEILDEVIGTAHPSIAAVGAIEAPVDFQEPEPPE